MRGKPNKAGVCFSTDRPSTRLQAEKFFSVFEWGNNCANLTEFLVPPGTPIWVGEVDPGDPRAKWGSHYGVQVFIENPFAQKLIPGATVQLANDLGKTWLHTGRIGTA